MKRVVWAVAVGSLLGWAAGLGSLYLMLCYGPDVNNF